MLTFLSFSITFILEDRNFQNIERHQNATEKIEFKVTKAKHYERVQISFDSMLMAFLSWHCRCKCNLTDHHCFCSKLKTNILHSQKSCFIRIVSSSGAFTLAKFNSKHSVYNSTASFNIVHKWNDPSETNTERQSNQIRKKLNRMIVFGLISVLSFQQQRKMFLLIRIEVIVVMWCL